jgi:NAD(P)-dependent dehydrogenase (short-subunit alcohol dehydrogenase family)
MSKIAIISGASSGIGAAAALAFAERGVHSIVTYNSSEERALRIVDEVKRKGAVAKPLRLDVGQSGTFASFRASVAAVLKSEWRTQQFDYLVNNAGFGQMAMLEDTTEELFDQFMRVLLKGPYFLTQALLPLMADGGAIVNVASNSAMTTGLTPGYSAYASMKGGVITLSRYMAKEFAPRGIRVNTISPGSTRTGMITDEVIAK